MSKIKTPQDLSNVQSWEELRRYASQAIKDITDAVNGGIDVVDNCSTSLQSVTFSAANAEVGVSHGLGRAPRGWTVVKPLSAMQVYGGNTADSDTNVYVKSSAIGSCQLLIF